MGWGFAYLIGVTAAFCVGGPVVFAQSPDPIDPPDPKRLVVVARTVVKSELIVYDPIAIRFGSTRPLPEIVVLPRQHRVAIAARLASLYLALPVRMRTIVSARMDRIDIAVPEPHAIGAAAKMEKFDIVIMPEQRAVAIALRITAAELEMPAMHQIGAVIGRQRPEVVLITEPLAMYAVIERRRAPVFVRHRE